MAINKQLRPSADKTRGLILQTARRLFIQHGFAGTSMSQLAKQAEVNQSLISHHFGNKKKLWQQVKASIIADAVISPVETHPRNLRAFLTKIIYQQFDIFTQHPELIRLLSWQRLEPKQAQLMGGHATAPTQWLVPFRFLQKNGQLDSDVNPEFLMIWIAGSVTSLMLDDHAVFKQNTARKKVYIDMLIERLYKAFAIKPPSHI